VLLKEGAVEKGTVRTVTRDLGEDPVRCRKETRLWGKPLIIRDIRAESVDDLAGMTGKQNCVRTVERAEHRACSVRYKSWNRASIRIRTGGKPVGDQGLRCGRDALIRETRDFRHKARRADKAAMNRGWQETWSGEYFSEQWIRQ